MNRKEQRKDKLKRRKNKDKESKEERTDSEISRGK
jgi:hypothetical protein